MRPLLSRRRSTPSVRFLWVTENLSTPESSAAPHLEISSQGLVERHVATKTEASEVNKLSVSFSNLHIWQPEGRSYALQDPEELLSKEPGTEVLSSDKLGVEGSSLPEIVESSYKELEVQTLTPISSKKKKAAEADGHIVRSDHAIWVTCELCAYLLMNSRSCDLLVL